MPAQTLPILFPAAGVGRRLPHSAIPQEGPFPTPWSMNVRLVHGDFCRLASFIDSLQGSYAYV
jgi:hypothetical protein